ncbi:MAG: histidine triad nucleotide-binding protein [Candidatus Marinimicrobia bacterium]|nr:histidine triad nucleotide-binding protein [Candidatus Neomarinimicrobiota bacterium]
MDNCIFCKIGAKEIPSDVVYEDDHLLAFRDLNPQAPEHILVIPKKHIARIENLTTDDTELMGRMLIAAKKIADNLGLKKGYRLVFNNGPDGGQEVEHIHLHLMGGRKFSWPAG